MNKNFDEGIALAREINDYIRYKEGAEGVRVILAPPYIHLAKIARNLTEPSILVAAQDCSAQASGAYTGEVSAAMIASTGARLVIIGHSERRAYHGETNETLALKIDRALENNLDIIYCVGETLPQREAEQHFPVVSEQLSGALFHLTPDQLRHVIIAYEPVWAIGTGRTATPDQAQEMHAHIRATIARHYGQPLADDISILYGGSCNPRNADALFTNPDVDGGLIGGASLNAPDFFEIIKSRARH